MQQNDEHNLGDGVDSREDASDAVTPESHVIEGLVESLDRVREDIPLPRTDRIGQGRPSFWHTALWTVSFVDAKVTV